MSFFEPLDTAPSQRHNPFMATQHILNSTHAGTDPCATSVAVDLCSVVPCFDVAANRLNSNIT